MNKGLKTAKGDIVGFLNSDDKYNQDTLKIVNNTTIILKLILFFGTVKKYKIMHGFHHGK